MTLCPDCDARACRYGGCQGRKPARPPIVLSARSKLYVNGGARQKAAALVTEPPVPQGTRARLYGKP